MHPGEGHALTYGWSVLLGFFSVLSLQDGVFIVWATLSAFLLLIPITPGDARNRRGWRRIVNAPRSCGCI